MRILALLSLPLCTFLVAQNGDLQSKAEADRKSVV